MFAGKLGLFEPATPLSYQIYNMLESQVMMQLFLGICLFKFLYIKKHWCNN